MKLKSSLFYATFYLSTHRLLKIIHTAFTVLNMSRKQNICISGIFYRELHKHQAIKYILRTSSYCSLYNYAFHKKIGISYKCARVSLINLP